MGQASEDSKRLRPRTIPMKESARCLICGISKPLEFAHILPRTLFYRLPEVDKIKFINNDGINIMTLCINHHRLYDKFDLEEQDFALIAFKVFFVVSELMAYNTHLMSTGTTIPEAYFTHLSTFLSRTAQYGQHN